MLGISAATCRSASEATESAPPGRGDGGGARAGGASTRRTMASPRVLYRRDVRAREVVVFPVAMRRRS